MLAISSAPFEKRLSTRTPTAIPTGGECAAGNEIDEIPLAAGTYILSIAGRPEEAAATGDLDITDDVTLRGAGATTTTIDAAGLDRVIEVFAASVDVFDLTVTGGAIPGRSTAPGANGGGIMNSDGDLTLTDVVVSGNSADEFGGGIASLNYSGEARSTTIINSTVSENEAANGGGISFATVIGDGSLTIVDSTISSNYGDGSTGGIGTSAGGFSGF